MKNGITRVTLIWTMLVFVNCGLTNAQPNYPTDHDKAELIYSDVENFLEAFKILNKTSDTVAVLNEYYFDRASAGLKEYIGKHNLTSELLKGAMIKDPERYAKIADFFANRASFIPVFKTTMQGFNHVLPSAMYPPTYLLVGANRGIAQASKFGQLVTITKVLDNDEKLKKLIVHELSHFQQAMSLGIQAYGAVYSKPNNMLDLCLREGGAEYITFLVLNEITQAKSLVYFQDNESDLKSRFMMDLAQQNTKFWLWDSIDDPDTPNLLGYVMGYKICEAYYQNTSDKKTALNDILAITQPEEFLESSNYIPK
tara:strand:- start:858 stop:1793 length:936 start_codon:yes stop_codon:yes gene_type:complete